MRTVKFIHPEYDQEYKEGEGGVERIIYHNRDTELEVKVFFAESVLTFMGIPYIFSEPKKERNEYPTKAGRYRDSGS